jgi:hypothetical protein
VLGKLFAGCLLAGLAVLPAACASAPGAAPHAPPATDYGAEEQAPAEPLTTVDDARFEFERAARELDAALSGGGAPAAPGAPPYAQPPPSPEAEPPGMAPSQPGAPPAGPVDRCAVACRALASMRRAAAHLCGLTGQHDARCVHAGQRLSYATDRVRHACPGCRA